MRPFRFGGLALFALAAVRLAEGYFAIAPDQSSVLNDRTAATAVLVVLAYALARQWRRHQSALGASEQVIAVALHVTASVLTMMWMSVEISDYWHRRRAESQARLSEELMRSLSWGAYGSALVVVGMWRSLVSIRWIGIAVIGLTVLKVFFVDLSELGGIYRVDWLPGARRAARRRVVPLSAATHEPAMRRHTSAHWRRRLWYTAVSCTAAGWSGRS